MANAVFTYNTFVIPLVNLFEDEAKRLATFRLQLALCNLPFTILALSNCYLQFATGPLQPTICNLQYATCQLQLVACQQQLATCHLPLAICNLPLATCHLPCMDSHLQFSTGLYNLPLAICNSAICHLPPQQLATCHL